MTVESIQKAPGAGEDLVLLLRRVEPDRVQAPGVDPDTQRVAAQFASAMKTAFPIPQQYFQQQPSGIFVAAFELVVTRAEYEELDSPVPGDEIAVRLSGPT